MKLEFTISAFSNYNRIKQADLATSAIIKEVLEDTLEHPSSGMGNPTPLTGDISTKWVRTFSLKGIIIYSFTDECLKVELIEADSSDNKVKLEGFSKEDEDAIMSLMAGNRERDKGRAQL